MVTAIVQITQFQSTPPVKAATNNAATNLLNITFQSTPPVKAATRTAFWSGEVRVISIHAAREGGDEQRLAKLEARLNISIHAAREGGDSLKTSLFRNILISIHAAREGGDNTARLAKNQHQISIHAAREGGDSVATAAQNILPNFNPRRP